MSAQVQVGQRELRADVVIVGGGTGGVAAALAVAEAGRSCVMTEVTDWIGGQLTAQAVPPDEHRWIEKRMGPRSYFAVRDAVRAWYRSNRRLTARARENEALNPGNGWVAHLCAEPRVFHAVLCAMLEPHVKSGRVKVLLQHEPVSCEVAGDVVKSVRVKSVLHGGETTIVAGYVLDATEFGDVYGLAGVEHAIGAEARAEYGEIHAPEKAETLDQQACSWCFAMEHRPGEDHTIARPSRYSFWRDFVPKMHEGAAPWTGKLFSWTVPSHNEEGKRTFPLVPWPDEPAKGEWELWRYRRIVDASVYEPYHREFERPGAVLEHPDVSLVNWVQMDYWLKPLLGVSKEERAAALEEAREQSRCLLYWMQTEAPRHDSSEKTGYPGLKLRGEELGTADGFAKHVYVREPARLLARTVVHEGHIGTEQRTREGREGMDREPFGTAEAFADSVGIGHYTLDLHPSCSGRNSVYVPAAPFRIPLGSLIPRRVVNVLAAGKGIGVTHITNGCYRMHHTEWNIGEAAGALAAWCIVHGVTPAQVHESAARVADFQGALMERGVMLKWPWEA